MREGSGEFRLPDVDPGTDDGLQRREAGPALGGATDQSHDDEAKADPDGRRTDPKGHAHVHRYTSTFLTIRRIHSVPRSIPKPAATSIPLPVPVW